MAKLFSTSTGLLLLLCLFSAALGASSSDDESYSARVPATGFTHPAPTPTKVAESPSLHDASATLQPPPTASPPAATPSDEAEPTPTKAVESPSLHDASATLQPPPTASLQAATPSNQAITATVTLPMTTTKTVPTETYSSNGTVSEEITSSQSTTIKNYDMAACSLWVTGNRSVANITSPRSHDGVGYDARLVDVGAMVHNGEFLYIGDVGRIRRVEICSKKVETIVLSSCPEPHGHKWTHTIYAMAYSSDHLFFTTDQGRLYKTYALRNSWGPHEDHPWAYEYCTSHIAGGFSPPGYEQQCSITHRLGQRNNTIGVNMTFHEARGLSYSEHFGSVFVSSSECHTIMRVHVKNTTQYPAFFIAGNGTAKRIDGIGLHASFNRPTKITGHYIPQRESSNQWKEYFWGNSTRQYLYVIEFQALRRIDLSSHDNIVTTIVSHDRLWGADNMQGNSLGLAWSQVQHERWNDDDTGLLVIMNHDTHYIRGYEPVHDQTWTIIGNHTSKSKFNRNTGHVYDCGAAAKFNYMTDATPIPGTDKVLVSHQSEGEIFCLDPDCRHHGEKCSCGCGGGGGGGPAPAPFTIPECFLDIDCRPFRKCELPARCRNGKCHRRAKAKGVMCRASKGPCDEIEFCDGRSLSCPTDALWSSSTVCRRSAGDCDAPEYCTGKSVYCPRDRLSSSATMCRPATSACDTPEYCTGEQIACPADYFMPKGTACRAAVASCDQEETCSGHSPVCPPDAMKPNGYICRPPTTWCGTGDLCNGTSYLCPGETLPSPPSTASSTAGPPIEPSTPAPTPAPPSDPSCPTIVVDCSSDEQCQPPDVVAAKFRHTCVRRVCLEGKCTSVPQKHGFECRPAKSQCDIPETCDGKSLNCPVDTFSAAGVMCRRDVGSCDLAEFCNGRSGECPADLVKPHGTLCRASAGPCDETEVCTGMDGYCPADQFKPSTVMCRPPTSDFGPGMTCDAADFCTGRHYACSNDRFRPEGARCETFERTISTCDGLSRRCRERLSNETEEEPPGNRSVAYNCDKTCYLCNVDESDLRRLDDGSIILVGSPGTTIGRCSHFVRLPFPACARTCVAETCPNAKLLDTAAYFRQGEGEEEGSHSYTHLSSTASPWTCEPSVRTPTTEGVAGGDPRYTVNGEVIQCDTPGEQLYAQNKDFGIFVTHTPVSTTTTASYISKIRVSFAAFDDEVLISNDDLPWATGSVGPASAGIVVTNKGLFGLGKVALVLRIDAVEGASFTMFNLAVTANDLTSGIVVDGCPTKSSASPIESPDHPACSNITNAIARRGCNFDIWATGGDVTMVKAAEDFELLVVEAEYQPPTEDLVVSVEEIPVAEDGKATAAPLKLPSNPKGKPVQPTPVNNPASVVEDEGLAGTNPPTEGILHSTTSTSYGHSDDGEGGLDGVLNGAASRPSSSSSSGDSFFKSTLFFHVVLPSVGGVILISAIVIFLIFKNKSRSKDSVKAISKGKPVQKQKKSAHHQSKKKSKSEQGPSSRQVDPEDSYRAGADFANLRDDSDEDDELIGRQEAPDESAAPPGPVSETAIIGFLNSMSRSRGSQSASLRHHRITIEEVESLTNSRKGAKPQAARPSSALSHVTDDDLNELETIDEVVPPQQLLSANRKQRHNRSTRLDYGDNQKSSDRSFNAQSGRSENLGAKKKLGSSRR